MATNKKLPTVQSLPDNWVETAIGLYEVGAGDEEVIKELKITEALFNKLITSDDYFMRIIQYGRLCRKAWFLRWARLNLNEKGANYSGWFTQMKNLFGWSDKQQQIISDGELENMSNDEIERRFSDLKEEILKLEQKKVS